MRKFLVTFIVFTLITGFNMRINKYNVTDMIVKTYVNPNNIKDTTPPIHFHEYFRRNPEFLDSYDCRLLLAIEQLFGALTYGTEGNVMWFIVPIPLRVLHHQLKLEEGLN